MVWLLLASSLAAVPTGADLRESTNDCDFYVLPQDSETKMEPVYVDCHWAEFTVAQLDTLLNRFGDHDTYFNSVAESTVRRTLDNGKLIVWQRHVAGGISDREVNLIMWRDTVEGGYVYHWRKAREQGEPSDGNVVALYDTGSWTVTRDPRGGTHVEYYLHYAPGGRVPGFVVRWFQGAGIEEVVSNLRNYASR